MQRFWRDATPVGANAFRKSLPLDVVAPVVNTLPSKDGECEAGLPPYPVVSPKQQSLQRTDSQNSHQHAGKGMSRVGRKSGCTTLCSRHV